VACHQATGHGLPGVFPPLAGSEWVTGKESLVVQIVLHGVSGDLTVSGNHYNGQMPTFKDKLGDAEIAAVVSYIRGNFGNTAAKVDAATVKAQRAATAAHSQPWNGDAELQAMK
jgi:mono/diheme cytochrome c family protein